MVDKILFFLGGGGTILDLSKGLDFQRSPHSQQFRVGVKFHKIVLKRGMVISAGYFYSYFTIFLEFLWELTTNIR